MFNPLKTTLTWILDIVLLRPPRYKPGPKAVANPPSWDVPLDQTEAPMHYEGDTTSV